VIESLRRFLGRPRPEGLTRGADAELRAQVRRLEVRARQAMEAGLAGQYQSAFRGRGLEFEEVRDYRVGDDVRTIDWNVTARTGLLHVKRFREERDLTVLLLVDLSSSTRFGSGVMTVHDLIAEVSSLFALAAARRDRVGAVLFDDGLRRVIPPRRGWRHGLRVVREVLVASPAGRGTALVDAVRAAHRIMHRRGIVVLVVDEDCPLPRRELLALAGRHEVVVVRVGDPLLERGYPAAVVPVADPEAGDRAVLAGRPRRRPPHGLPGVDLVELSTATDYLPAVRAMLERRERRRAH
jgi:uncharacterized protein (DUF58 family)